MTDGVVTRCEKYAAVDDLEETYRLLCEQRGAFFKWSLEDKMAFADSLPEKLASAKERDTLLSSSVELEAIAAYGFCLPVAGALSQDEACAVASDAMAEAFGIAREDCAGVYYSFFRQEEHCTLVIEISTFGIVIFSFSRTSAISRLRISLTRAILSGANAILTLPSER